MATKDPSTNVEGGGAEEVTVNTVVHRSPAEENQPETTEKVKIVHDDRQKKTKSEGNSKSFLAGAAVAMGNTVQSAKDVISGDSTK